MFAKTNLNKSLLRSKQVFDTLIVNNFKTLRLVVVAVLEGTNTHCTVFVLNIIMWKQTVTAHWLSNLNNINNNNQNIAKWPTKKTKQTKCSCQWNQL